jgi:GH25 family lysozyme M1 (1,4-beta-N-acetylmuramidase)
VITFCDISEYQDYFDADAYLGGGSRVIIVRAHNGRRSDNEWPMRRDYVRTKPFAAVGYYQYVVADRGIVEQAMKFTATVGQLKPNEFPICDIEEGVGDQTERANAWFSVVDAWAGFPSTLYAGKSFIRDQLGGVSRWRKRPLWIAAYLSSYQHDMASYPAGADWWQYSDRAHFPGLVGPVDASVFPDDVVHFLPSVRPSRHLDPDPNEERTEATVKSDGRIETFVETASGEVVHKYQTAVNNGWIDTWQSLGVPGSR